MTVKEAQGYTDALRRRGYAAERCQFSPDRTGWGVAVEGRVFQTVGQLALMDRVAAESMRDFMHACEREA